MSSRPDRICSHVARGGLGAHPLPFAFAVLALAATTSAIFLAFFVPGVYAEDWPMRGHDPQRTGASNDAPRDFGLPPASLTPLVSPTAVEHWVPPSALLRPAPQT